MNPGKGTRSFGLGIRALQACGCGSRAGPAMGRAASLAVLSATHALQAAEGRPGYVGLIPNGDRVPGDRQPAATGHVNPQGHGERNQFGLDFHAAGLKWTRELCLKDSDGDGRSNGEELGDPDCVWKAVKKGKPSPPTRTSGITHPGVADAGAPTFVASALTSIWRRLQGLFPGGAEL